MRRPSLSTHVLDLRAGLPAAGVAVSLYRVREGAPELRAEGRTDDGGRIADLAGPLEPGTYQLVFEVGPYLRGSGETAALFTRVSFHLDIRDGGRDYHVPLLLSPHACTCYRGS